MFDLMPRATSVTSRQSSLAPVAYARLFSTVGRTYTINEDVGGEHQCALHVLTLGPLIWDAPKTNGVRPRYLSANSSGADRTTLAAAAGAVHRGAGRPDVQPLGGRLCRRRRHRRP